MYDSRKAFTESESNKKIRRAIKSKLWSTIALTYPSGDHLFYKRNDSILWKDPVIVMVKKTNQLQLNMVYNT